jgi:glycine dehydrogenase
VTDRPTLSDLERGTPFADRHIGPRPAELDTMLAAIGAASLDELAVAAVPDSIRDREPAPSTLPPAATETEVLAELRALAERNTVTVPMIGLGYSGTIWRTRPGTPRTPRTSRRSARVASRRC